MDRKIKVLLVDQIGHKGYFYDYGAAKNYSDKYEVTCYESDNTPHDVDITGFNVVYGFRNVYTGNKISKGLKYVKSLLELRSFIRKNHFDIVTLQWYDLPIVDKWFVKSIKRLKDAPKVVMTVHGIIPREKYPRYHDGLQKLYEEADTILIHSEQGLEHFNKCFDINCPKYVITSAFRDENDYTPMDKRKARQLLGVPNDKTVILSFGTIREDKSIDLLFKAFPKAYNINPELFLLFGGTLNVKDKEYYQSLAERCDQTGSSKIVFDYVDKDLEPAYYSAADILVVPYSYISQSGVAYCGLLYELPMIASDIPRLDLMAKSGINAEIFEKGSEEQLTQKIIELASNPTKLMEYKEGSKRIREEDFSIKKRVAVTEQAYEKLLSN